MPTLPAAFLGHGNPMNAVSSNASLYESLASPREKSGEAPRMNAMAGTALSSGIVGDMASTRQMSIFDCSDPRAKDRVRAC